MSNIRNTLIAALLTTATGTALAASSVDLAVKGSITPSACTPSLSSGGTVDFGKMSAKDLNADKVTRLESDLIQLRISCDAATLFAFKGDDNRKGSVPDGHEGNFGLGLINGNEKLGSYYGVLTSAVADNSPARFIGSQDGGATWFSTGELSDSLITSVANTTSITPIPVQELTGDLKIKALIAPANSLTLTSEVPLDGSVTLTVSYL
ncbi:DUF1120 domain-containing protein [Pseudomonas kairouanensis]|uniref:DUF1120 domain-containing protein n=1 Tax=Pseudomonas kairouanensis TaxID=2293832 RepID=A0A4Z0B2S4_9PSED|nr:DUF1120 domain-containing protein [Pseudomonas kairouanensis]TFY92624.1 DUF1120 domain-containing protein [Pseudomonas kairouanensis]